MDLQDWGAVGEVIGAVATIATIGYLALQIRRNTEEQKRQALVGLVDRLNSRNRYLYGDSVRTELYLRGQKSFRSLNDVEKLQYGHGVGELFSHIESYLDYGASGNLKKETTDALYGQLKLELQSVGAREWWKETGRQYFAKDFVHLIDEMISAHESAN